MDEFLVISLLVLPVLFPFALILWGVLTERFSRRLPLARTVRMIGIPGVLLCVVLPYVTVLATEFDAYVFAGQSSMLSFPVSELGLRADGFGFAARILAAFLALLLLSGRGGVDARQLSEKALRVLTSTAGLLFGFFLLSGTSDLLMLWGGVEILVLSAFRLRTMGSGFRAAYRRGGYYSGLGAMGLLLFYGLFGTTSLEGIETALSTQNVEIVPVQPLLLGMLLLLGGFIARIGSCVAGGLAGVNTRSTGVASLFVLLSGAVLAIRLFTEMFPAHLFGIELVHLALFAGGGIGLVSILQAIGTEDPVKSLSYAMGGHLGIAILGFASGSAGTLFGSGTWMLLHIVLTAGVLYMVTVDAGRGSAPVANGLATSVRKALTGFLFLALAGMPFTGGFFSRIVLLGAVNPLPEYLRIRPVPQRYYAPLHQQPADIFGSVMPVVLVGTVLAVLLLYAYGRLFRGLYFAGESSGFGHDDTL